MTSQTRRSDNRVFIKYISGIYIGKAYVFKLEVGNHTPIAGLPSRKTV